MNTDIQLMHNVWNGLKIDERRPTALPDLNFDEIVSSVFATGPFYFYIIDFYDLSISNISSGFEEAHGINPKQIKTINDILALVHPDDMDFVSKAEEKALGLIYKNIGAEKITSYKESYNFRFKTADGSYKLYNHQSLILTTDEKYNFVKSLNIHTNISHITQRNNHKVSLIGLSGESSYLNIDVYENASALSHDLIEDNVFTKRELEIIKLLSEGYDTKSIADKLFITSNTVKSHRKHIFRKSKCSKISQLISMSLEGGWV